MWMIWNLLKICFLISFDGSNQHWRHRTDGNLSSAVEQHRYTDLAAVFRCEQQCILCVCVCVCMDAYLLVMAVPVCQTKVVLLH